jgi:hypothetical protein
MNKRSFDYIPIHSKADLEKNLRGYHIGKKFIDDNGNIFTVRLNTDTRSLEIVKIVLKTDILKENLSSKTPKDSHKVFLDPKSTIDNILKEYQTKVDKKKEKEAEEMDPYDEMLDVIEEDILPDSFTLEAYGIDNTPDPVEEQIQEFRKILEVQLPNLSEEHIIYRDVISDLDGLNRKVKGVLSSLRKSNVYIFWDTVSTNNDALQNYENLFDYEVVDNTERLKRKYKELLDSPKNLFYYTDKLPSYKLRLLDSKPSDDKMYYIIRWELLDSIFKNAKTMHKLLFDFLALLNSKSESDISSLNHSQITVFQESKKMVLFCLQCTTSLEKRLNSWKEKMIE